MNEIKRLREQATLNRKRERQTYGKMFFRDSALRNQDDQAPTSQITTTSDEKKKPVESITEYLEKKHPKPAAKPLTMDEKEIA